MDTALWIAQLALGLIFLAFGLFHISSYQRMLAQPMTAWVGTVGEGRMRIIGILELAGAIGLMLPTATGILPWLSAWAAAALAALMACAIVFHARRVGEVPNIIGNAVLGAVALFVAWGRFTGTA